MIYRELGKTGMRVGIVGMGCEGFLEKTPEQVSEFIDVMQAHGANCIDLYSPNPDMRKNLGLALQGRRQDFICSPIFAPSGKTDSTSAQESRRKSRQVLPRCWNCLQPITSTSA